MLTIIYETAFTHPVRDARQDAESEAMFCRVRRRPWVPAPGAPGT